MKQKESDYDVHEAQIQSQLEEVAPGEIVIGSLQGFDERGKALVNYPGNPLAEPLVAISTVALNPHHMGRQVALLFADANPETPIVIGLIHSPLHQMIENFELSPDTNERSETSPELNDNPEHIAADQSKAETSSGPVDDVYLDGKRVVLEGKEEVVLKCGDASITLTKAGKILIRGKYLLSRSSGVNRILGGSVQVN